MGCNQSKTDDRLTVIVVHYNPQKFKRRAELANDCLRRLSKTKQRVESTSRIGLNIIAVELQYAYGDIADLAHNLNGGNAFMELSSEIMPIKGVQMIRRMVASKQVMWSKEQLINLAIRSLPEDEKYVAWIDSDIGFTDDSWVSKAIHALSKHPLAFGQLWATCDMLGPNDERQPGMTMTSFAQQRALGKPYASYSNRQAGEYWHPGFAWIATMGALRKTRNLIDKTLGSADRHMAMSFISRARETVPDNIHASYRQEIMDWQEKVIMNGIELVVVPVHIVHYWHGPIHRRQYMGRWTLLKKHRFNPSRHLRWDSRNGLYLWSDICPEELIEDIIEYFENRQEDSSENGSAGDEGVYVAVDGKSGNDEIDQCNDDEDGSSGFQLPQGLLDGIANMYNSMTNFGEDGDKQSSGFELQHHDADGACAGEDGGTITMDAGATTNNTSDYVGSSLNFYA